MGKVSAGRKGANHSGYRNVGGVGGSDAAEAWAMVEKSGRNEWVTDLAEIPEKYGVTNVYGDLGQLFAASTVAQPKLAPTWWGVSSRVWAPITSCGVRMLCGPVHRGGKSRD